MGAQVARGARISWRTGRALLPFIAIAACLIMNRESKEDKLHASYKAKSSEVDSDGKTNIMRTRDYIRSENLTSLIKIKLEYK